MKRARAALYLDFDNVFGGLVKLDPEAAFEFAENPAAWLGRLTDSLTVDAHRRWLVLRCYMNPAGWLVIPGMEPNSSRIYFSKFRPFFTAAGFDVIDCPRLTHTKNAADIRLVLDARDALDHGVYDEFVIGSGDSDMTPLLVRLRSADRRTTIISPSDAADAFTAIADRLITGQQFLALIQGEQEETTEELDESSAPTVPATTLDTNQPIPEGDATAARFREIVAARYAEADAPLNLASLAHEVRRDLGAAHIEESGWLGYGTFGRAVSSLELPGLRMSQHALWDDRRHPEPEPGATVSHGFAMPEAVARITALLNVPRLPGPSWLPIYCQLAAYARTHHFNLTEATRWTRDRLVADGVEVSRAAVGFVTQGAAYGGCPLYRQPPPDASEIAAAFVANLVNRAEAAGIPLTAEDKADVGKWLGAGTLS